MGIFSFAGECIEGTQDDFDESNQDIFTLGVSGIDDDNSILDDVLVTLNPDANITIAPSSDIESTFTPMEIKLTVENVTSVIFKFYDENGTLVDTVRVSQPFFCFGCPRCNG